LVISLIAVPLAILVAVGLFFLIKSISNGPRIDESAWKEFRPPGARCRLLLPGTPKTERQFAPGLAQPVTAYVVELKRPNCVFARTHLEIPPQEFHRLTLDQRFDGARQGMLSNAPPSTKLVSQREKPFKGNPGREYVLEVPKQGKMTVRVYLVKQRDVYVLLA